MPCTPNTAADEPSNNATHIFIPADTWNTKQHTEYFTILAQNERGEYRPIYNRPVRTTTVPAEVPFKNPSGTFPVSLPTSSTLKGRN